MTADPLTDIMAPSCFGTACPPIYREVGTDLGFFPDIQPLTIERVARIYNVPVEVVATREFLENAVLPEKVIAELHPGAAVRVSEPEPERYGRWLHPDELPTKARRPWVATEQLDATQQIPVIRDEPCE